MCAQFEQWRDQIRKYCEENNLNFQKVCASVKCWRPNLLILQMPHSEMRKTEGLRNDTPLPILLRITKVDTNLQFEQTAYTQEYLAN